MSGAFYNEIDPYCAQWLRNLITAGHIAPGIVDERSIEDIAPDELREYTQCHFFAGIGVWSHALRLAGWPDDRPVWTGSCPCQPFSQAGKGTGFADERHLWPAWFHLIRECRPGVVFGEQVASQDGLGWLDLVHADLEGAHYAIGAADLCAAGVGAPHIRQRLFFVANTNEDPSWRHTAQAQASQLLGHANGSRSGGAVPVRNVADADVDGRQSRSEGLATVGHGPTAESGCGALELGDANNPGLEGRRLSAERARELFAGQAGVAGYWADADWIACRDGKWRPVEPGTFPLAHGLAGRMGKLRAYGNAIVAPLAAEFVGAYLDTMSNAEELAA